MGLLQALECKTRAPGVRDFGATLSGCTKIIKSFSRGFSRITFLVLSYHHTHHYLRSRPGFETGVRLMAKKTKEL